MENGKIVQSWSSKNVVDYYLKHRDSIDEIYDSEKRFLGDALKNSKSVLDIGCAAGGFSKVIKAYSRDIAYTGVDISPAMVEEAKRRFPDSNFYLCDGERLDFRDASFDVCISFGVLHMTLKWERLLREAWRACREVLLFDLRLVEEGSVSDPRISYQKLEFDGRWDGLSKAPYVVLGLEDALGAISGLKPEARCIKAYGYWHPVSSMTVSRYKLVCMAVFCLEKRSRPRAIDWQLPLKLPEGWKRLPVSK